MRREFLAAVAASTELHGDWVHPPRGPKGYAELLRRARTATRESFVARANAGGRLVGVVNVDNIVGGSFCNATLGYYGFVDGVGGGRMTESIRLVVDFCFRDLALHRVEANIQPANARSRAIVERLGFRHEGFSPRMLMIGGEWRDHERYALTREEWPARP
jgi:ribosomal-protein-alanine N-acetyltransferase